MARVNSSYGGRLHDWGKTYRAFSEALLDCGEQLNERGREWLTKSANEWIRDTDAEWPHHTSLPNGGEFGGDHDHPWYSGQLHDSTLVRLAEGNKTFYVVYMPQRAVTHGDGHFLDEDGAQNVLEKPRIYHIIGREYAARRAQSASNIHWKGSYALQAQLIVGVPYAQKVNESGRHRGYLEELEAQFYDKMTSQIGSYLKHMMIKPRK